MDHPDDFLFMDRSKGKLELWTEDSSPGLDHGLEIEVFLKHKYEMWHPIRGSTSFLVCYSAEPPPPSRFSFQVHRNLLPFPCLCKTHFIRSFSSLDLERRLRVSLAAEVYLYLVKIDAFNRKGITVKCELELVDVEKMDEIVPAEDCKDGIQRGAPPAVVERLKREAFVAGVAAGDCMICLEELCEGKRKRVVKMPCSHVFHENCLVSWLEGMNTCPVCRFEIDQANK